MVPFRSWPSIELLGSVLEFILYLALPWGPLVRGCLSRRLNICPRRIECARRRVLPADQHQRATAFQSLSIIFFFFWPNTARSMLASWGMICEQLASWARGPSSRGSWEGLGQLKREDLIATSHLMDYQMALLVFLAGS
ncbi:hypothetical protein BDW71DRAFT_117919 [Aspergillus fruticulosus]